MRSHSRENEPATARLSPANRPLVLAAAAFAAGILYGAQEYMLNSLMAGTAIGAALTAAGLAAAFPARLAMRTLSVLLMAFAAGIFMWQLHGDTIRGDALSRYLAAHMQDGAVTVEGTVRLTGLEQDAKSCSFLVDVSEMEGKGKHRLMAGGVSVRWKEPTWRVTPGDTVRVTGKATPVLGRLNPGVSSYEDHLRGQGIHSAIHLWETEAVTLVRHAPWWSPRRLAGMLRQYQADRLTETVPPSALPFVLAVWLGFRGNVTEQEYERFVESGTVHILSVSGIHMMMVYLTAHFVLQMLIRRRLLRTLAVMAVIMVFVATSGMRPSAMRAAAMILIYLASHLFNREPDTLSAMGLSALVLLGINPPVLFDGGFQLSFLSVSSMLMFNGPLLGVLRPYLGRVAPGVSTSLSAQILTTPLALAMFHVVPLGSIAANLLVVPLSTAVLWLSLLTTLTALIPGPLVLLFSHALAPVVWLIHTTAHLVAAVPFLHVSLTNPALGAVAAYYTGVWLLANPPHGPRWLAPLATAACLMLMAALWTPLRSEPMAVFLDVGHGDSAFVRTKEGRTLLVDGGEASDKYDADKRLVAPFLYSNHVRRLDIVALSHADCDHLGGLFHVIRNFHVGRVLVGDMPADHEPFQAFLRLCAERGVPVTSMSAGQSITAGDLVLTALGPPAQPPPSWEINERSLVLKTTWQGLAILFPGDIEEAAETALAATPGILQSDILKAPHHGSRTSSSESFIAAVAPSLGIISTGGAFGTEHVDEGVLARYRASRIVVQRTDSQGGISLTPEGEPHSERSRRGYPTPRE